jgi:TonB family protein
VAALGCAVVIAATGLAIAQFPISTSLAAQQVVEPGDGVTLPVVLSRVQPRYTKEAQEKRIQGTVWLSVVVKETGDVGDVTVTRSLDTRYGLDEEAVKAARQWRFEPGKKDGKAVPVQITLELTFSLK